jgi:hypothetical protein
LQYGHKKIAGAPAALNGSDAGGSRSAGGGSTSAFNAEKSENHEIAEKLRLRRGFRRSVFPTKPRSGSKATAPVFWGEPRNLCDLTSLRDLCAEKTQAQSTFQTRPVSLAEPPSRARSGASPQL